MKNIYPIGDIAKLLGLTPEALRHYERIGLVAPTHVADNGYRYYDTREYTHLFFIKKYRSLGFSLEEIKELLHSDSDKEKLEKLSKQKNRLKSRISDIKNQINSIMEFESGILHAKSKINAFDMVISDERWFVPVRTEDGLCLSPEHIRNIRHMMDNASEVQFTMLAELKRNAGKLEAKRTLGFSSKNNNPISYTSIHLERCAALKAVIKMSDGEPLVDALERTGVILRLEELGINMNRQIFGHMTNMSMDTDELWSTFEIYIPVEIEG